MKILYLGDGNVNGPAGYLVSALCSNKMSVEHLPPDADRGRLSKALEKLSAYESLILSDFPRKNFSDENMENIETFVSNGGGLCMLGGWESFSGNYKKHNSSNSYRKTPIELVLPVECKDHDDRINNSNGFKIIKRIDHEITKALPWSNAPTICGHNSVTPKKDSSVVLTLKEIKSVGNDFIEQVHLAESESPLLIIRTYKKGRTLAFTTDPAPHWIGGLVDWGNKRIVYTPSKRSFEIGNFYSQFMAQMIQWVSH